MGQKIGSHTSTSSTVLICLNWNTCRKYSIFFNLSQSNKTLLLWGLCEWQNYNDLGTVIVTVPWVCIMNYKVKRNLHEWCRWWWGTTLLWGRSAWLRPRPWSVTPTRFSSTDTVSVTSPNGTTWTSTSWFGSATTATQNKFTFSIVIG